MAFLRQLAPRLKPASYAVKGGVNLRFFFGSIRYSEDMDLDIREIETFRLKEIVLDILGSRTLLTNLRPFMINKIVLPDMKVAKQTETTQRFKVHLMTEAGEDLFTKIEFSRRKFERSFASENISETVLRPYKLTPFVVSHYLIDAAVLQKVAALANRAETQGRDIFDIYMIMPRLEGIEIPKNIKEKAYQNIFNIDYEIFRDTVVDYLNPEDQKMYNKKEIWEDMQLKVGELLK